MEQTQKSHSKTPRKTEEPVAKSTPARSEEDEELIRHSDELLDAIDDLLEENAEQFVAEYIQSGGQ